jgi:hypothetical protein
VEQYVFAMSRFKSRIVGPSFSRQIGPAGEARIENGEPWLLVWSQQLAIPLSIITRKTKIALGRLRQIAAALQTDVRLILESRR